MNRQTDKLIDRKTYHKLFSFSRVNIPMSKIQLLPIGLQTRCSATSIPHPHSTKEHLIWEKIGWMKYLLIALMREKSYIPLFSLVQSKKEITKRPFEEWSIPLKKEIWLLKHNFMRWKQQAHLGISWVSKAKYRLLKIAL